jgi:hypothetical protein
MNSLEMSNQLFQSTSEHSLKVFNKNASTELAMTGVSKGGVFTPHIFVKSGSSRFTTLIRKTLEK